jgi:hypothetical protein
MNVDDTSAHAPPGISEHAARITCIGREPTTARLRLRHFSARERALRALRALLVCWAMAVAFVLVPLLHFVLVPAMLVAGPLFALQRRKERVIVLDATGSCPACGGPVGGPLGTAPRPRMRLRCEGCGREVHLEPDGDAIRSPGGA